MDDQNKDSMRLDQEELLKRVENAAKSGAGKGRLSGIVLQFLPLLLFILLVFAVILPRLNALNVDVKEILKRDEPAENHDLVTEDEGALGYTAADFEDAILGDGTKLKKLEVYSQEVSDVSTITDTGLLNLGVFSKNQLITYNGTVVYTVDLTSLKKGDILFDEEEKLITLRVPHAAQEEINIPEERIHFGDTKRGLLAFGEIKMTPAQAAQIQTGARSKMQEKLDASDALATADRFAILSVWEIYSPIVKSVAKDYSLEVEFR